jgi:thiamine biosynthesis lipoprotein
MMAMAPPETPDTRCLQRARPLLGTLVQLRLRPSPAAPCDDYWQAQAQRAMAAAFGAIAAVQQAMSAHHADSDLACIARAAPGSCVRVSPHTVAVLRLAKYWQRASAGAFDPVHAANRLAAQGRRPAFDGLALPTGGSLDDLQLVGSDGVRVRRPVRLDLGGIAKGYAVDCAVTVLRSAELGDVLVNAGGDLRAAGQGAWPVQVRGAGRQPGHRLSLRSMRQLRTGALATSNGLPNNPELVPGRMRRPAPAWQVCSVSAPDCVTADVLTKWGLQAPLHAPRLQRLLRTHGAALWRA